MKKKRKIVKSFFALLYVGALSVPLFAYAFNYFKDWHNASAYNEQTSNLLGNESVGDLVQPTTNTYYEKKYYETNELTFNSTTHGIEGFIEGNIYKIEFYNSTLDETLYSISGYVEFDLYGGKYFVFNFNNLSVDEWYTSYLSTIQKNQFYFYASEGEINDFACYYYFNDVYYLTIKIDDFEPLNSYFYFIYTDTDIIDLYSDSNILDFIKPLTQEELQNYYYYEEIQVEDTNIGGIPSNQEIQMPTMNDVSQSTLKSMGAYEGNDAYLSDMIDNSNNLFIGIDYFGLFGFDIENNASNSAYSYLFINWYINYILSMALIVFMPEILLIFIQWCRDLIYSMTDRTEGI